MEGASMSWFRKSVLTMSISHLLLMGPDQNVGLRSINTTCACGTSLDRYLAAVIPPQPPPQMTMRGPLVWRGRIWLVLVMMAGADRLVEGRTSVPSAAAGVASRKFLRFIVCSS